MMPKLSICHGHGSKMNFSVSDYIRGDTAYLLLHHLCLKGSLLTDGFFWLIQICFYLIIVDRKSSFSFGLFRLQIKLELNSYINTIESNNENCNRSIHSAAKLILLEVALFQLNQFFHTIDKAFSNFIPDSKRFIFKV